MREEVNVIVLVLTESRQILGKESVGSIFLEKKCSENFLGHLVKNL